MADSEPPDEIGFLTDRDLENLFEHEQPFADELESQTLARVHWLETRHRAVFLIMAHELGVDPETVAKLSVVQMFLSMEFGKLISIGIDADHDVPTLLHPMDEAYNDLVAAITEPKGFNDARESLWPMVKKTGEVLGLGDEDLLHRLEEIKLHGESAD